MRIQTIRSAVTGKALPYCIINTQLFKVAEEHLGRGISRLVWAWGTGNLELIPVKNKMSLDKSKVKLGKVVRYTDAQARKFILGYTPD